MCHVADENRKSGIKPILYEKKCLNFLRIYGTIRKIQNN